MTYQGSIGKYRVIEAIGTGGFATVFKAYDESLDRNVALKVLHPVLLVDESFVECFFREARTAARLHHPGIVTIYEVGEAGGRVFIAMELAATNLAAYLTSHGRFAWADVLALLRPVCAALDYAHGKNVIHRDLKPANILLTEDGRPLLSDFGLARLASQSSASMSVSGGILGTPAYIAPEVWAQNTAEAPADLYALACITHELITGNVLFQANTPLRAVTAHVVEGARFPEKWPAGVPADLARILAQALSREPEKRFASAMAFWHHY